MLSVTQTDIATALGLTKSRASTMMTLAGVPYTANGGKARRYAIAAVLPITPRKYRVCAERLLKLAVDDGELYCNVDLPTAEKFCAWIAIDDDMAHRLRFVRTSFFNALYASTKSNGYFEDSERIRVLLATSSYVLPFILTGTAPLPDFKHFARAFVLIHTNAEMSA